MGYFDRLKTKWNIRSNRQLWIIFIVFGITGSSSVKVGGPVLEWLGVVPDYFAEFPLGMVVYWILRVLIIFPIYQLLLLFFGALFFQFPFFWEFEKKILRRMGFQRFFPES
ncbi:MAG: DUF6787 family protein [Flavobacteriaceae bacterium]